MEKNGNATQKHLFTQLQTGRLSTTKRKMPKSTKGKQRGGGKRRRSVVPRSLGRQYASRNPNGIEFKVRRMAQDAKVYYDNGTGLVTFFNADAVHVCPWATNVTALSNDFGANNQTSMFGLGCQFALTDIIGSSEFTTLFNEYRLDKIVLRISTTTWGAINGTASQMPSAYVFVDHNDAVAPASSQVAQQRDNCQLIDFTVHKAHYVTFTPKCAQQIYTSGLAVSYGYQANNKSLWLDTTSPSDNTPHYGVKMFFRNFDTVNFSGTGLRIQPTYYMTFRNTR